MPRQPRARSVFSFSSKYGFLTYSQCDLTAEIIQQMLITLLTPFNLLFLAVAPEHHQDGSLHFHVLFQCARRIITRRVDFFDLNNYHPNIQPARDSAAVLEYISKEQPPIVWGEFQNHKVSPSRRDDRWRDIIFTSTSKAEYLNRVKQEFPADYATRLQQLEYSAERLFPTTAPPYVSPFDPLTLQCHEDIQDWINRELYLEPSERAIRRPRSLYICGPTRTAKTTWARQLGRHNYWNGGVDFSTYDPHATYNIADDIPFKFFPSWKQLIGGQKDFTVNPKYGKKMVIPGGIPCIILVNQDEDWLRDMSPDQKSYFLANCTVHYMSPTETFIRPSA
ncbi:replication-associated protein [Sweet potato symptomless virus 1]|uniref:Replication-associated protein n=1 Tax=Sweet potato symptomless virus 1 TaxID=603333 RepID=A0A2Z2GQM8_9GEMI|nr:replication-associated protein [Sweet potato symptomless virus 1]ARR74889.1 replication-associated protein [Sweet potato symptomless virus 1]ARR74894.1 replication-associated protein [Sweet potato symptomless virus 1]UVW56373.1 replication-associated protein [Sweet potato symptomless virus 1]